MVERKLEKRIVVVTGVSNRAGIGFAMAQRFLRDGAKVLIHSFRPPDAERSSGADPGGVDAVIGELGASRIAFSTSRPTSANPMRRGK